ncbi:hypothetical protein EDD18DRAFT_1111227 [Armillaria luteobubalina]|uniref:Uncharacterized protein n=1 Tax=Armillaria luteobubalina TaxID=153913 RepID=A0AA39PMQ9_9AGAR|nr:hypothetical protein EDD18DRAFT_1111227 [Armillaria luteobubalina]
MFLPEKDHCDCSYTAIETKDVNALVEVKVEDTPARVQIFPSLGPATCIPDFQIEFRLTIDDNCIPMQSTRKAPPTPEKLESSNSINNIVTVISTFIHQFQRLLQDPFANQAGYTAFCITLHDYKHIDVVNKFLTQTMPPSVIRMRHRELIIKCAVDTGHFFHYARDTKTVPCPYGDVYDLLTPFHPSFQGGGFLFAVLWSYAPSGWLWFESSTKIWHPLKMFGEMASPSVATEMVVHVSANTDKTTNRKPALMSEHSFDIPDREGMKPKWRTLCDLRNRQVNDQFSQLWTEDGFARDAHGLDLGEVILAVLSRKNPEFRIGETSEIGFLLKSEHHRVNENRANPLRPEDPGSAVHNFRTKEDKWNDIQSIKVPRTLGNEEDVKTILQSKMALGLSRSYALNQELSGLRLLVCERPLPTRKSMTARELSYAINDEEYHALARHSCPSSTRDKPRKASRIPGSQFSTQARSQRVPSETIDIVVGPSVMDHKLNSILEPGCPKLTRARARRETPWVRRSDLLSHTTHDDRLECRDEEVSNCESTREIRRSLCCINPGIVSGNLLQLDPLQDINNKHVLQLANIAKKNSELMWYPRQGTVVHMYIIDQIWGSRHIQFTTESISLLDIDG